MTRKQIAAAFALSLAASNAHAFEMGDVRNYDFSLEGPELTELGFDCVYGASPVCTFEFTGGEVLFGLPMETVAAKIDTREEDVRVFEFTPRKSPLQLGRSVATLSEHFGTPFKYNDGGGIHHVWFFEDGTSAVSRTTYDEKFEGFDLYDEDGTDYIIKHQNLPRP